jgi:5-methylcytosine-specific restriction endonuclease McrA
MLDAIHLDEMDPKLIKKAHRKQVLESFGGHCFYCGQKPKPNQLTIDHVTPVVNGGTDSYDNLVPCCRKCNKSKGDKDVFDWLEVSGHYLDH